MTTLFKQRQFENGSSAHRHFITKLMLITARSYTTIQRLHSSKFTLVNKAVHSTAWFAVRCVGRHFQMGGCLFTQSHADHVIGLQDESDHN